MANKCPDYLVENHIGEGDDGYSSFSFEDSPARDEVALVADNDQEAAAETTVTHGNWCDSITICHHLWASKREHNGTES